MGESRCINCMKKMEARITCPHGGALQQADANYPYAIRPNTILHGKYLIGRVLGQGGCGRTGSIAIFCRWNCRTLDSCMGKYV